MPKKPAKKKSAKKKSAPKKSGPRKKTGPKGPRKQPTWTEKELTFVEAFRGNQTEAAKIAYPRSKNPAVLGSELMAKPHIREAIDRKLAALHEESGKRLARVVDIGSNEIIMGLADIFRGTGINAYASASARVAAAAQLKDIFGLSAKNDDEPFAGWSTEQLREFSLVWSDEERSEFFQTGIIPRSVAARALSRESDVWGNRARLQ
jgi:hypothetical protein